MSITEADVKKIANLARLAVTDEETSTYNQQLNGILDLVVQMNEIDTDNIPPMAHPMDASQRLRKDVVTEEDQRELMQSIAPQTEAGLYLVPQVIEEA